MPLQLRHRLAYEPSLRPTALVSRTDRFWRLERSHGLDRRAVDWDAAVQADGVLEDSRQEDAIVLTLDWLGARALHFEGLAGLAPRTALRAAKGRRLLVTVHDFSAVLPAAAPVRSRPRASAASAATKRAATRAWRRTSRRRPASSASGARRWPTCWRPRTRSCSLRVPARRLARPAPAAGPGRQHVIEPGAIDADPVDARPAGPVRHVALVGAATPAKGAALLPDIVRATEGLRFTVLGGGDAALLRGLRRLPETHVRGYYRAGSLAHHLRERDVDVALVLSLVPESYGMTLDECWQAGVPVIAFDHGAVAERIRRLGGGVLVPLEKGAAGVAETLRALHDGTLARPRFRRAPRWRRPSRPRAPTWSCIGSRRCWNRVPIDG